MTLREQLRQARAAAFRAQSGNAGEALRDVFLCGAHPPAGAVVSFYYPIKDEMDVLPLARALAERGHPLCLPCVLPDSDLLVFRAFAFGDELKINSYGLSEPLPIAPVVEPTVLLVPLLGFDHAGNRIGLGGGYYDRTLAVLRAKKRIYAAGIAFAAQEIEIVPTAPQDQKMDLIATEREVIDPSFSTEI